MSLPPPKDNYIGEPGYPSPWTTKKPREGLRDTDKARIVSLAPDVCKTPVGSSTPPIPYPVVDYCGHDENYTPSVRFTKQKTMVLRSNTQHVHGDEPGVAKGVKSGTVGDISEPIGHAKHVRAEGSPVIRHLDRFHMNKKNTEGEAIFVRDTATYEPLVDDDPVPGSLVASGEADTLVGGSGNDTLLGGQSVDRLGVQSAQAQPNPSPNVRPTPNAPNPAPRGPVGQPGNVIQGPWKNPPPPSPEAPKNPLIRYGRWGLIPVILMLGGSTPLIPPLPRTADAFERELNRTARNLLSPFDHEHNQEVRKWYFSELGGHRKAKRQQQEEQNNPIALPQTQDVRVTPEEEEWKCLIGEYDNIHKACRAINGNTHHVVPDMAYRLGDRKGLKSKERTPNSPTEGQGESICLTESQHSSRTGSGGIHDVIRPELKAIGHPDFPGTAPMEDILRASQIALLATKGIDPKCAARANARAEKQVRSKTGLEAPGRIKERPLPSGAIAEVLRAGSYP